MSILKRLYDALNSPEFARYGTNVDYLIPTAATENGGRIHVKSKELLEIERPIPFERVTLAYPDDDFTRLLIAGDDQFVAHQTLTDLRMSSHPRNVGEIIFSAIRRDLEELKKTAPPSSFCLARRVFPGNERYFLFVLRKLVWVFGGGTIGPDFFESLRMAKSRQR